MTDLTFTQEGDLWYSDTFGGTGVIGLQIVFPEGTNAGYRVELQRTMDDSNGWASAFSTVISAKVWEENISGCYDAIDLRLVCNVEPEYAGYEVFE